MKTTITTTADAVKPLKPELEDGPVQRIVPKYTIGQDAGMRTWNVSDQFCVLLVGFTARSDAEAALRLLCQLHLERMEVQKWADKNAKLRAALEDIQSMAMARKVCIRMPDGRMLDTFCRHALSPKNSLMQEAMREKAKL